MLLAYEATPEAERGAWLRREGLHEAELAQWRLTMVSALDEPKTEAVTKGAVQSKRIRQLERELHRKDRALAEAAALLVLQKKVRALWEAEDDDTGEGSDS
ncbi:MAG: transposase [Myxococcaceae bacterium]|nr:MAG: transposase [Myxococcaceae bacterium]